MGTVKRADREVFKAIARSLFESQDIEAMAENFTKRLTEFMEVKGCAIFTSISESKVLEPLGVFGLSDAYMDKGPIMAEQGLCAFKEGRPIIVPDVQKDPRVEYPEAARKEGIASIVSVPISFYSVNIAGLRVYHDKVWDISEDELDHLLILAGHVGLAMMTARLMQGSS